MKKNTLIIALLIPVLFSCNKTEKIKSYFPNNPELATLATYSDVFTKKTNAVFGIIQTGTMHSNYTDPQVSPNSFFSFQGEFITDKGELLNGGIVKAGDTEFKCNPLGRSKVYGADKFLPVADFSGKNIPFSFQKPYSFTDTSIANQFGGVTKENLYVPKMINITSPKYENDAQLNTISTATVFKWDVDPNNIKKGIIVGVEYDPNSYGNINFKSNHPKYIIHGTVIEDNGSIQIPESLFSGIAKGAEVKIVLGRANYKLFTDAEGIPFTLYAYNCKYGFYTFK